MIKHLTILLAVDHSNMSNGCLEVVSGSHEMQLPIRESDHCLEYDWVDKQTWTPVELEAGSLIPLISFQLCLTIYLTGQLLIFGSYLAHRSAANSSDVDRKALYATYNRVCEGDLRKAYYEDRKKLWPATHMRKDGEDYAEGSLRYGFGSPMLSIETGQQMIFMGEK